MRMCEIIIDGKTVEFEGSVLTEEALKPYRETARLIKVCKSVTEIGDWAFYQFEELMYIDIPSSVKELCKFSFCGCESLKNIKIPNSVEKIGNSAFANCISLKSIEIPKSVAHIGESAFMECDNIRVIIKGSEDILSPSVLSGHRGQIITIDIGGNKYPVMTIYNNGINESKLMVRTGFVDYANGKLCSGYEFNENLDQMNKNLNLMYCYCSAMNLYYDSSLSGLKAQLERDGIR